MKRKWLILSLIVIIVITPTSLTLYIKFTPGTILRAYINRTFFKPAILNQYEFQDLDNCENRNDEIVKTYLIYKNKTGCARIKITQHTLEGDPLIFYLIINNGNALVTVDSTNDRYSTREFWQFVPYNISFGHWSWNDPDNLDDFENYHFEFFFRNSPPEEPAELPSNSEIQAEKLRFCQRIKQQREEEEKNTKEVKENYTLGGRPYSVPARH